MSSRRRSELPWLCIEPLEDRWLMTAEAVEPTVFEQYALELMNRARGFPLGEVSQANAWVDQKEAEFPGSRSLFDWDGTPGLNEGLSTTPPTITAVPKQPLAFNLNAIHAARDYSEQLLAGNAFGHFEFGHEGTGTATPWARAADAGVSASVSENIGVFQQSAAYTIDGSSTEDVHFGLVIDSGVAGRGHRRTIMSDAHREVGIGLAAATTYNRPGPGDDCCPNAVLVTQDFLTRSGFVFLTGVAYNDTTVQDDFYTPGEGVPGVTITATPVGGGALQVTTTYGSGGYALQLADGAYSVTATGPFGTTAPRFVAISGRNVKLDIVDGAIVVPQLDRLGIARDGLHYLDSTANGVWDRVSGGDTFRDFGINSIRSTGTPVTGDWDGNGTDDLGMFSGGYFYLDTTGNGAWDKVSGGDTFRDFGINAIRSTGTPVIGDWEGNGTDDLGMHTDGYFYLDTTGNGVWDKVSGGDTFRDFGIHGIRSTGVPVVGDWDGNGTDDLGLYTTGYFYLDTTGNGVWDKVSGGDTFRDFGINSLRSTATPVVGDWDGNGTDDLGLYAAGYFYLDTTGNGVWDKVSGGDTFRDFGINAIRSTGTPVIGGWAGGTPLLARGGPAVSSEAAEELTRDALAPIVDQALAMWAAAGLDDAELQRLQNVQVRIADLPGARLGEALGTTITMDADAAGYGWFIDATPTANEEFGPQVSQGFLADTHGPAADRIDLMTAVLHEMGHVLGHGDEYDGMFLDDVMNGRLPAGVRRLPEQIDLLFAGDDEVVRGLHWD
jgi:hypothetical protein